MLALAAVAPAPRRHSAQEEVSGMLLNGNRNQWQQAAIDAWQGKTGPAGRNRNAERVFRGGSDGEQGEPTVFYRPSPQRLTSANTLSTSWLGMHWAQSA